MVDSKVQKIIGSVTCCIIGIFLVDGSTRSVKETPHRKWGEIDLRPCCWLHLALPGWCLFSPLFLRGGGGVSSTNPVYQDRAVEHLDKLWK